MQFQFQCVCRFDLQGLFQPNTRHPVFFSRRAIDGPSRGRIAVNRFCNFKTALRIIRHNFGERHRDPFVPDLLKQLDLTEDKIGIEGPPRPVVRQIGMGQGLDSEPVECSRHRKAPNEFISVLPVASPGRQPRAVLLRNERGTTGRFNALRNDWPPNHGRRHLSPQ